MGVLTTKDPRKGAGFGLFYGIKPGEEGRFDPEDKDDEDPYTPRKNARGYKCGGKVKRRYKRGGVVRGAGICKRGIRKAKMY